MFSASRQPVRESHSADDSQFADQASDLRVSFSRWARRRRCPVAGQSMPRAEPAERTLTGLGHRRLQRAG